MRGEKVTVARSGEITNKKTRNKTTETLSYKTLDATIQYDIGDNATILHKRNDEATTMICERLGVSKAIINYVLFCHQEDSDWPLGTDQSVRDRFDRIFETAGYNKALEKINKATKEHNAKLPVQREHAKFRK